MNTEITLVNTSQWCIAPSSIMTDDLVTIPGKKGILVLCDSFMSPIKESELPRVDIGYQLEGSPGWNEETFDGRGEE